MILVSSHFAEDGSSAAYVKKDNNTFIITFYKGMSFYDVATTSNADEAEDFAESWVLKGDNTCLN